MMSEKKEDDPFSGGTATQEEIPSATDIERDYLFDRLDWMITTTSPGLASNKKAHIPVNMDSDDRGDTDTFCGEMVASRGAKLRRKPIDIYPQKTIEFCDFCVREWREA